MSPMGAEPTGGLEHLREAALVLNLGNWDITDHHFWHSTGQLQNVMSHLVGSFCIGHQRGIGAVKRADCDHDVIRGQRVCRVNGPAPSFGERSPPRDRLTITFRQRTPKPIRERLVPVGFSRVQRWAEKAWRLAVEQGKEPGSKHSLGPWAREEPVEFGCAHSRRIGRSHDLRTATFDLRDDGFKRLL